MKLEHLSGIAAVGFFALALAGCGAQQTKAAQPAPNAVGVTQLMSAEMHVDNAEQLKVGKSQQHITDEAVSEDEASVKDPPRRNDHRRGGGFSGWK